jgi:hypothetical protein
MKKHSEKHVAFTLGGLFLIAWAVTNTVIGITRYGAEWGSYWWFCNLALMGIGIGLLIRSRGLLTGFLAIACFTQVFWLVDNLMRQLTGTGPFGLVDFMYRPGYPVDEFILSHYHYFTMPIALIALFYLPQKKNDTLKLIAIFNPFIFAVSYFVFPAYQNVNCIHQACFASLSDWEGPIYSISFWAVVFAMHLLIGSQLDRLLLGLKINAKTQSAALKTFGVVAALALAIVVQDTHYKMSLPTFACNEASEAGGVTSGCQYTKVHYTGEFMLTYYLQNDTAEVQYCKVGLTMGPDFELLNTGATVMAGSRLQLNAPVAVPTHDVTAKVVTKCKPLLRTAAQ